MSPLCSRFSDIPGCKRAHEIVLGPIYYHPASCQVHPVFSLSGTLADAPAYAEKPCKTVPGPHFDQLLGWFWKLGFPHCSVPLVGIARETSQTSVPGKGLGPGACVLKGIEF